jgi:GTP cyclohydrolase FolE2
VLEKNVKEVKIHVKMLIKLQKKENNHVLGKNLKKVEENIVVQQVYFVEKKIVEDYLKNVNGLEKLYGGHQEKNVNGK